MSCKAAAARCREPSPCAASCAHKSEGAEAADPPSEDDGTCADDSGVRDEDDVERLRLWLCCAPPRTAAACDDEGCADDGGALKAEEEEERGGYPPDHPSEDDGTCADDGGGRDGPAAPRDDGVRDEDDVERLRL